MVLSTPKWHFKSCLTKNEPMFRNELTTQFHNTVAIFLTHTHTRLFELALCKVWHGKSESGVAGWQIIQLD